MGKVTKLASRDGGQNYRKFSKKRKNRLVRKAAKQDPEGAPRRTKEVTEGWSN